MKKLTLFQLAALSTLVVPTLIACSAKVESSGGGGAPPAAPLKPFEDAITGPKLAGKWKSGCEVLNGGQKHFRLRYEFNEKRVSRTEEVFDDATCAKAVDFKMNGGSFRFVQKLDDDTYEIESRLGSPEGLFDLGENIRIQESTLTVSYGAKGTGVVPNIKLIEVDENDQPIRKPEAKPAPKPPTSAPAPAPAPEICPENEQDAMENAIAYATSMRGYTGCRASRSDRVANANPKIEQYRTVVSCREATLTIGTSFMQVGSGICGSLGSWVE